MLEAIRKYTGSLVVKLLFVVLILSFGVWGVADVFRPGGGGDWAIQVGDVRIPPQTVREEYQRELRRLRETVGDRVDQETARAFGLPNEVIGNIVTRTLLDLELDRLNLVVTDEAVRDAVQADPTFHGASGAFDPNLFRRILQLNGLSEEAFAALVRSDIARRKLVSAVAAGAGVPETIVETIFRQRAERRIVDYVFVSSEDVGPQGEPDAAQVQAYYDAHPEQFSAPEYRAATAVILSAPAVAATTTVADAQIEEAYQARRGEFTEPERRTVEQVLVGDEATAELVRDRLAGGAGVDAVARDFTAEGASSVRLDKVTRSQLPGELGDAAFALSASGVSAPVRSPLGWHVLRVVDIVPAREKSLAEVRDQLVSDLAQEKAIDEVYTLTTRLEDALGGGATLEEAAKMLGVEPLRVEAIDSDGRDRAGAAIAGLPETFARTVFSTLEKSESVLTESGRDTFFIVRTDAVTPAGVKPLSEVKDQVVAAWKSEQRADRAKARASAIAEAVRPGASLSAAAEEKGLRARTTPPITRAPADTNQTVPQAVVQASFSATPGETIVVPGDDGAYVLRVTEVIEADPNTQTAAVEALRRDLERQAQDDALAQLSIGIRREFPVTMNPDALEPIF